jgi:DNA polymerase V
MDVLRRFSPRVEVYSIDEAFLGYAGAPGETPEEWAGRLRALVLRCTGIPVSVGIAPSKTLAKIAARIAKKKPLRGGVYLGRHECHDRLLDAVAIDDVWGIGRRYAAMLRQNGITTARDLKYADDGWVRRRMTIQGLRTAMELRGIDCLGLQDSPAPPRSILSSRSFGRPVQEPDQLREALVEYVGIAAAKLRSRGLYASVLQVCITTGRHGPGPHYSNAATAVLPAPCSCTPDFIRLGLSALQRLYRGGFRYRKIGVLLTGLQDARGVQPDLFGGDPAGDARKQRFMRAVDEINARWGRGTAGFGVPPGSTRPWRMFRRFLSPRYTTCWRELPLAKT